VGHVSGTEELINAHKMMAIKCEEKYHLGDLNVDGK
jgi:hypothetical protein